MSRKHTDSTSTVGYWTGPVLSVNSRCLKRFFSESRVRLGEDPLTPIMATPETISRLSEWSEAASSAPTLWISGPTTEVSDFDNYLSRLAAKFTLLADQSDVPLVSYFCQIIWREQCRGTNTRESQAMIAMLYALLWQLAELLPQSLETNADLSESRFQRLDGTVETWEDALLVLRDLMTLIPKLILCVLDGVHLLDDRSTNRYLKKMFQVLLGGKLKVLFTTTGRSAGLSEAVSISDTLEVQSLRPRGPTETLDGQGLLSADASPRNRPQ
jgi:hypothetical protein